MATFFLFFLILTIGALTIFHRRKMSIVAWGMLVFSFLLMGGGLLPAILAKPLETQYPMLAQPQWQQRNAIVLLGGGITPARIETATPGTFSYPRVHEALRLYLLCKKTANECKMIISGGVGNHDKQSEAAVYRDNLLQFGVSNSDVILEERSKNTAENAQFTAAILQQGRFNQVFLVTSAIHMKRALLYFSHTNIQAIPAPSNYFVTRIGMIPRGYKIAFTDFIVHEYLGILKFYVFTKFGEMIGRVD